MKRINERSFWILFFTALFFGNGYFIATESSVFNYVAIIACCSGFWSALKYKK